MALSHRTHGIVPGDLKPMTPQSKNLIKIIASVLAIAGSAAWIYYTQYRAPKFNAALYRHVGNQLAETVVELAGKKQGQLVTITIPLRESAELAEEYAAFNLRLQQLGDFKIREDIVDTEGKPKYGFGTGLSGRHFLRTVKKNETADVIVSFIGAPKLDDEELAQLTKMPKFVVQARSPDNLFKLFEKKLVQAAVISRFTFPSPGPDTPKTTEEWFTKRFQTFRSENAASIPKGDKAE